jgi:hypothetical protein
MANQTKIVSEAQYDVAQRWLSSLRQKLQECTPTNHPNVDETIVMSRQNSLRAQIAEIESMCANWEDQGQKNA